MSDLDLLESAVFAACHESVLDDDVGDALIERLRALLRRDWAVRVLDVWTASALRAYRGYSVSPGATTLAATGFKARHFTGNPEAARLAAAQAVFPTLNRNAPNWPGECP